MTADPKAAEREAEAHTFIHGAGCACTDDAEKRRDLARLLTTRERDAAVGALRELHEQLVALARPSALNTWKLGVYAAHDLVDAAARRLALEQGAPATATNTRGDRHG